MKHVLLEVEKICKIKTGNKDVNEGDKNGKYPFFTCAAESLKSNTYSFDGESILLPGNGVNVGLSIYFNGKFEAYQRTYVLNNFKDVLPKYVYYYFKKFWGKFNQTGQYGSATNYIRYNNIAKFKVPIFTLDFQRLIILILEQCDSAIEKRKQANKLTDEFLKSAFIEMFGDPEKNPKKWTIGILDDAIKYSEYGTSEKSNSNQEGYPVLGMGNITYQGSLDLTKFNYMKLSEADFNKIKLKKSDVIFNRTNSTELVGKTTYWDQEFDAVIASYLVKLCMEKEFNYIWFSHLLNTKYYKKLFTQRCKKAVGQSNISPTLLKQFPMYKPPLPLQQKFATLVKKVENLKQKQNESEKELNNLFNSLMQKAFKGELV